MYKCIQVSDLCCILLFGNNFKPFHDENGNKCPMTLINMCGL